MNIDTVFTFKSIYLDRISFLFNALIKDRCILSDIMPFEMFSYGSYS